MKHVKTSITLILILIFSQAFAACGDKEGKGSITPIEPPTPFDYKYTKAANAMRLLTYNSFYCKSNTSTHAFSQANTQAFADVIKALDADIVAIQELDSGASGRQQRYLLQQISDMTSKNYQVIFGHAADFDNGAIGCGLLINSKYTVVNIRKVALPGNEPRILIIAELPHLVVMATHLDLNVTARKTSAQIIINETKKYNKPVVLMGDLNDSPAWEADKSCFTTLQQHFSAYNAIDGSLNNHIDYILLSTPHVAKWTKQGSAVVKQLHINGSVQDLTPVSDHYPVYIDFVE